MLVLGLVSSSGCGTLPQPYRPPGGLYGSTGGRTFYVSAHGDDGADGMSPGSAWRTLHQADRVRYRPGDRLLLEGGARFEGSLRLDRGEANRPRQPVIVGSYGRGRATVVPSRGPAVEVVDTAGVEVRDLIVRGGSAEALQDGGISFYNDSASPKRPAHIVVSEVDVSGFRHGVQVGGERRGFRDVRVTHSVLHGNRDAGLITYRLAPAEDGAEQSYAHANVVVDHVEAHDNTGDPHSNDRNTGSGIVLGSVDGGAIRNSVAHDNGSRSSAVAEEGPEGLWGHDARKLVIEHNVSYRNHSNSEADGDGIGLDLGTSDSVIQYNLSYENDGAGFLLYSSDTERPSARNVMRFNVSSHDARKLDAYGGFYIGGYVRDARILHNTVVTAAQGSLRTPAVVITAGPRSVSFWNNQFVTDGTPLVAAAGPLSGVAFQGNQYHAPNAPHAVEWQGSFYSSPGDWWEETGQESVAGTTVGIDDDPCFAGGPAVRSLPAVRALVPACRTARPAAVDLRARFGVDPGPVDVLGHRLGRRPVPGAVQPQADAGASGEG
ncbi:right-handed parallel beta-helix repeat-containing protein [Streptomyces actinomycinicus]|uniref:Right-handed parallel beta-helix repeat-containing protein n=1 Tax=Streptomyces actinomycinicus TaxID=1695166 RepID=A0A937JPZ6_9ACTN|nr:right-handed parallel beta-helix repeat-containing protein [Streptomyces actinomycinicus]MBL1083997.1 right-handed parallel beta-helix repeat-containing protein [Streptomyces actinomycinicus]